MVEATGAYSDEELQYKRKFEGDLLDYLNQHLKSDKFVIRLFSKSRPNKPLACKKICRYIQSSLDRIALSSSEQLKPETLLHVDNWHKYTIYMQDEFGWNAEFSIEPKIFDEQKIASRSIVGGDNKAKSAVQGIRDRIDDKRKQFGKTQIPYIVAINVCYPFFHDKFNIYDALFGDIYAFYQSHHSPPIWLRRYGSFLSRQTDQARNVSGLLFFNCLVGGGVTFQMPSLWHHPFAERPLNPLDWKLKQKVFNPKTDKMEDFDNSSDKWIFEAENERLMAIQNKEWL